MDNYMEISLDFIPFPNPDVLMKCENDGSATLVNFDSGHALSLNAVGRFIWEATDGDKTVEDLICRVRESFEGVPDIVDDEVLELVKTLALNGFFGYEVNYVC